MEIKLAITLRLLRGACALDMIWYGVQIQSVAVIFSFVVQQLNIAYPDDEVFNFNPAVGAVPFRATLDHIASEWSEIMMGKISSGGNDLFKGTILAGDGMVASITAPTRKELILGPQVSCSLDFRGGFCIDICAFLLLYCRANL